MNRKDRQRGKVSTLGAPQSFNEYKAHRQARLPANDQSVFPFVISRNGTMECLGTAGLDDADQPVSHFPFSSHRCMPG
jgi:hypothetical protein